MRFALIGNPISHSLSPALFSAAYPGSTDTYELLEADSLEESMRMFNSEGFKGINVTAPYKEEVLRFADRRDPLVDLIGAANLLLKDNDVSHAYNTDCYGVMECIKGYVSKRDKAVILGCGGAGRAAAVAAMNSGCEVTIVNRSWDKARDFSEKTGTSCNKIDLLKEEVMRCKLFINTIPTPIEMFDSIDFNGKVVLEANYRSPQLAFVANRFDAKYISGKSWLLYQAVQSFQLFTGIRPNLESMQFMLNNL